MHWEIKFASKIYYIGFCFSSISSLTKIKNQSQIDNNNKFQSDKAHSEICKNKIEKTNERTKNIIKNIYFVTNKNKNENGLFWFEV